MKKRLCIIGFGGMGNGFHYHQTVDHDLIELAGIYDIDEAKIAKAQRKGIYTYSSLQEVLDDKTVDIVTVAIPNDDHCETVIKCLEAGKNVICEKPVALSSEEYQRMIDAAEKAGKVFTVHQNRRWDSDFVAMKKIYESGEIGEVFNIESRVQGSRGIPGDWRREKAHGGGMLYDWGVHLIDQMLQIYKQRIVKIFCNFSYRTGQEVDDGFSLKLFFEDGAEATVELGTYNFIALPRFYMQGETGTAYLQGWNDKVKVATCREWYEEEVKPIKAGAGLTKTMAPRDDYTMDEYEVEQPECDVYDFYRNVVDAIDGKAEQLIKHDEVMRVMRVMEAAFESGRIGMPVEFKERF